MVTLMELPSEVRSQIINTVLQSRRRSLPYSPSFARRNRVELTDWHQTGVGAGEKVLYEKDPQVYIPNCLSLLLTSHQLNLETNKQVSLLIKEGMSFDVDVALVKAQVLCPTWTKIPSIPPLWSTTSSYREVHTLNATFRIIGQESVSDWLEWSIFRADITCPQTITYYLYNLLERFLFLGASPPRKKRASHKSTSIGIRYLNLDVVSSIDRDPAADPEDVLSSEDQTPRASDERDLQPITADHLYKTLAEGLESIPLVPTTVSADFKEFVQTLFENVQTIRLSLDGGLVQEWDLGDALAEYPVGGPVPREGRPRLDEQWTRRKFEEWLVKTIQKRRSRNFTTPSEESRLVKDDWLSLVRG